jgi:alcohol dehydrogenase class IV
MKQRLDLAESNLGPGMKNTSVEIPTLVRMKPAALDRLGIYCRRADFQRVVLLISSGLPAAIVEQAQVALVGQQVEIMQRREVALSTYEQAQLVFQSLPANHSAIIGLGGGKALDGIAALFDATGFWEEIREDPFIKADWAVAIRAALDVKPGSAWNLYC